MAEFVTGFDTAEGVKQYDYNALGNKPSTNAGTVVSPNADYAEVAEWADGNPNAEDRTGFFVCLDIPVDGLIMRKATSIDDVKGVTMLAPAFSGNFSKDKVDSTGKLLPKYSFVGVMGIVPIIDNGTCTVGDRCMPDDNGCAVPSSNDMGYLVINRVDVNHVLILVEPNADMLQRIKTQMVELQKNGGTGGNGVADWSQNDPAGAGYIKNRTHWKETKGMDIDVFPETAVAFNTGHISVPGFAENSFIEGVAYKVVWNGTEYECVCYVEDGTYLLGNGALMGMTTETDHPFCIASFGGSACSVAKKYNTAETITIKVYSRQETTYHHLDPKYIKAMYYTEEVQNGEIVPPTTAKSSEFAMMGELYVMGPPITLVAGKTYTVRYNGTDYECVATAAELQGESIMAMGDLAVLVTGIPSGAYPFVMATGEFVKILGASIAVIPLDGNIPTVAIYGEKTEIHKMPAKFLPEEVYSENIPSYTHERILFSGKSEIDYTDNTDLVNFILENGNSNKISIRCGDLDGSGVGDGIYVFEKIPFNYGYAYMSRGIGLLRVCFICLQLYNYGGYFDLTGFYREI